MRLFSVFMVFSLFLCYGGLCSDGLVLFDMPEQESQAGCHNMNHGNKQAQTENKNLKVNNPGAIASSCCLESLLNAESDQSPKVDRILVHKIPFLQVNTILSKANRTEDLSPREHDPPDLQISNSTFLL